MNPSATMPMPGQMQMNKPLKAEGEAKDEEKGLAKIGGWLSKFADRVDSAGGGAKVFEQKFLGISIKDLTKAPELAAKAATRLTALPFEAGAALSEFGIPPFNLMLAMTQKIPGIAYIQRKTKLERIFGGKLVSSYLPQAYETAKLKTPHTRFWSRINYFRDNILPYKNKYNSLAGNDLAQDALLKEFGEEFDKIVGVIGPWNLINGGGSLKTTFSPKHRQVQEDQKQALIDFIRGYNNKGEVVTQVADISEDMKYEPKLISLQKIIANNLPSALIDQDILDIELHNALFPFIDKLKGTIETRADWFGKFETDAPKKAYKEGMLEYFVNLYNAKSRVNRITRDEMENLILDRAYDFPTIKGAYTEMIDALASHLIVDKNVDDAGKRIDPAFITETTQPEEIGELLKISFKYNKNSNPKAEDGRETLKGKKDESGKRSGGYDTKEKFKADTHVYKAFMDRMIEYIARIYENRTGRKDLNRAVLEQQILDAIYYDEPQPTT